MSNNLVKLAQEYHAARAKCDALKDQLSEANKAKDEAESVLLEAMTDNEVSSVRIEGLGLFSMTTTNYLSVNAANKPKFYAYLKASGNGGLLKEEVNPKTLTAFLKGHLVEMTKKIADADKLEDFDANKKALEYLKEKGAEYFSERGVSLRSK